MVTETQDTEDYVQFAPKFLDSLLYTYLIHPPSVCPLGADEVIGLVIMAACHC
jgi:hypothetical protein